MKKIALFLISIYQVILSPFIRSVLGIQAVCRFSPTCSEHMKQMILKNGFKKGVLKGFGQFRNCHPRGIGGVYGTNI